jgi:hypothetical protein
MRSAGLKSDSFQSCTAVSQSCVLSLIYSFFKTKRSFGGIEAQKFQLQPSAALRIGYVCALNGKYS